MFKINATFNVTGNFKPSREGGKIVKIINKCVFIESHLPIE